MPRPGGRRFVAVLFTDIVGSSDNAEELGDRRWRELVRRHHAIVRARPKQFAGARWTPPATDSSRPSTAGGGDPLRVRDLRGGDLQTD